MTDKKIPDDAFRELILTGTCALSYDVATDAVKHIPASEFYLVPEKEDIPWPYNIGLELTLEMIRRRK